MNIKLHVLYKSFPLSINRPYHPTRNWTATQLIFSSCSTIYYRIIDWWLGVYSKVIFVCLVNANFSNNKNVYTQQIHWTDQNERWEKKIWYINRFHFTQQTCKCKRKKTKIENLTNFSLFIIYNFKCAFCVCVFGACLAVRDF